MLTFANISQLCRICLRHLRQINEQQQHATSDNPHTQRTKAAYSLQNLPHLANMLKQFLAVDVLQQPDNFPQNICSLCYNAIEYFQQLCTVAEQSNETLIQLTNNMTIDEPEKTLPTFDDCDPGPVFDAGTQLLPAVKEEPLNETDDEQQQAAYDYQLDQAAETDAAAEASAEEHMEHSVKDDEETVEQCEDDAASAASKRKPLACQQCGKQVYKLPYLEAHIRSVHEGHPKPFLCRNCDKAFTRYEQLRSHMRNVHPAVAAATAASSQELELICEQCNRRYSTKNALGEHLKRHAQDKPHICEHCGVAKVTRTELLTHLRIHNPDWEKFKCKQCPQLFRHKSAISRHVRVVHEGQRRFQCGHCQKRFGTHASQMRHERLHVDTF